jgi:UDP-3-O-[3-hydroxymyristoyl] glucosamine N-acyltransferase
VTIYPYVYIGERTVVKEGSVLYPGVYIGDDCVIGKQTVLRANVVCEDHVTIGDQVLIHAGSVIGADGFGFAPGRGGIAKIPQVGGVRIGSQVEIGGLTTVDRGALEDTEIGNDTKLDSHVHVGHGAKIGDHSMLCAFSGIAGSARLGNWVVTGGHSAVNNRVELCDGGQVGAMSALTKSVHEKGAYIGFPAVPQHEWRRQMARQRRLGDLEDKVKALAARLTELEHKKAAD